MLIDPLIVHQIHKWDKKLAALQQIIELVSDEMGKLIDPLLDRNDLAIDEELVKILEAPGYWQFEVRRRIRALKKLQGRR